MDGGELEDRVDGMHAEGCSIRPEVAKDVAFGDT